MAQITVEQFKNFFKYYKGEEHQIKAIELLYQDLQDNDSHLDEGAQWIAQYRNDVKQEVSTEKKPWPITKQEMAEIMGCAVSSLPDDLMDDFAYCCELYGFDRLNIGYFLGQCGHESAGLRYPVEIHDGSNYEGRQDLNNIYPGDGVKFAGTGWIQVTGRYNHQAFSDYLQKHGQYDHKIMEVGKTYTSNKYPWSISGFWWYDNGLIQMCAKHPGVDEVGARVNGRMLPNGFEERRYYSRKAFDVLNISYPGN
jgi:predicted chitinase